MYVATTSSAAALLDTRLKQLPAAATNCLERYQRHQQREQQRAALRQAKTDMERLLPETNSQSTQDHYQIARVVHQALAVLGDDVRALARLARAVHVKSRVLAQYAAVATCWTTAEFSDLAERPNKYGVPLTWEHFVVFAGVPARDDRDKLIEDVLAKGLSVGALEHRVRQMQRAKIKPQQLVDATRAKVLTCLRAAERLPQRYADLLSTVAAAGMDAQAYQAEIRGAVQRAAAGLKHLQEALPTAPAHGTQA